jgi:hypothetical protein
LGVLLFKGCDTAYLRVCVAMVEQNSVLLKRHCSTGILACVCSTALVHAEHAVPTF